MAMVLELSFSPVERWLRERSSSGVSRAETRLMAVAAMAGSEAETSGVTFCGRISIWGSERMTRSLTPMAGSEE